METYLMFGKMTTEGTKFIKEWPESIKRAIALNEEMGGKPIAFYSCSSMYDFIAIGEAPNAEVAEAFRRLIEADGLVRVQMIRVFTLEEFEGLIEAIEIEA